MVTRRKKLLAAGLVLFVGIGLSWPLRRNEPLIAERPTPRVKQAAPITQQMAVSGIPASMAGHVQSPPSGPSGSAETAALNAASIPPIHGGQSHVSAAGRPAFDAIDDGDAAASESPYRVHVVHNGDTLERLAKKYLRDEGRALEIFDLNREVLSNPNLLPIGAELRIPQRDDGP